MYARNTSKPTGLRANSARRKENYGTLVSFCPMPGRVFEDQRGVPLEVFWAVKFGLFAFFSFRVSGILTPLTGESPNAVEGSRRNHQWMYALWNIINCIHNSGSSIRFYPVHTSLKGRLQLLPLNRGNNRFRQGEPRHLSSKPGSD